MKELYFPNFLFGSYQELDQRIKTEAVVWANHYHKDGMFPVPAMLPVYSGTLIWTNPTSDFEHTSQKWRSYFTRKLCNQICETMNWEGSKQISKDFEIATAATSWGALDVAMCHSVPNSIPFVCRRLNSLLLFWDLLDSLRFIDRKRAPVTFTEVMKFHFSSFVEMWVDKSSNDIHQRSERWDKCDVGG